MRIHVEGWRFLPHSIAIANQFQLLELFNHPELTVSFEDLPYSNPNWQAVQGLFDSTSETDLRQVPASHSGVDVTFRMVEPVNLKPANSSRTLVFGRTEWGILNNSQLATFGKLLPIDSSVMIVTPSHWSREGFIRSGVDSNQVFVVPWGVNPEIYYPLSSAERTQLRQQLGWENYFVFLNIGGMENANGTRLLLKAFASVVEQYPQARLVLKGCEALSASKTLITEASRDVLSEDQIALVKPRIAYIGHTLSVGQMAQLYQGADTYVSPYVASGFNLSVLEAMACGLPSICTAGGATDDFSHPIFTLKIPSRFRSKVIEGQLQFFRHPDFKALVDLMESVIEKSEFCQNARKILPQFIQQNFTWKHTVERLIEIAQPVSYPAVNSQNDQDSKPLRRLIVEGWRSIPHSYALINSYQLLAFLRQPNLELFHQDMPYVTDTWKATPGLFSAEAEAALDRIPSPPETRGADVTLRVYCPFNLATSRSAKTYLFACTEWGMVPQTILRGMGVSSFREAHLNSDTVIITASHWSKQGFLNSGADPDRVVVVPLGFDPEVYHPLEPTQRQTLRQKLGWNNEFVILNISVMWNERQGIDRLLKAFAVLTQKYPDLRLVLKGRDAIFPSKESIQKASKNVLTEAELERVQARMSYIGENLSTQEMAQLYQAADVYVSPYAAEGFNLPVLEAIACGLPVICTDGGATDDFTSSEFTWKIESKLRMITEKNGDVKFFLEPNTHHLIELMQAAIENSSFRTQTAMATKFVTENLTWKHVVERLLQVMFD